MEFVLGDEVKCVDWDTTETFIVVRINFDDGVEDTYDVQSVLDNHLYQHVFGDRIELTTNQTQSLDDAYDRAMRGIQ